MTFVFNGLVITSDLEYPVVFISPVIDQRVFGLYSGASLIPTSLNWTYLKEPFHMSNYKMLHLSGNSIMRTVSLGTEVSG